MNNLYDALELCLQELENGVELETVLARYPDLAGELRPILNASIQARSMAVSAPSPEAVRRGRAKLLQHAAQMREGKVAPRKRVIPIFQRLAISFALTAAFLTSGTGLVGASSTALPGEKLYPVKLTWENVRLFFTFSHDAREALEHAFENERLHEVNELLVEGRDETIQFAGVYTMDVNGFAYVSGVRIVILETSILPPLPLVSGAAVIVTGHTNAQGFVDIETIELLPAGTVVPAGDDSHHNDTGNGSTGNDNNNDNNSVIVNENDGTDTNTNDDENTNVSENSNGNENVNENDSNSDSQENDTVNSQEDDNTTVENNNSGDNVNEDHNDNGNDGGGNDNGGDDNSGSDSGGDNGNDHNNNNDNNNND